MVYKVKFDNATYKLYATRDLRRAKEAAQTWAHQGTVVVEKYDDNGKFKGVVYSTKNPRQPKPSLVGSVADYFVPIGLMEQTAQGAAGDLSRVSKVVKGRGKNPLPKPVIHVARVSRGNYHVTGMEIPESCHGGNCRLPNPGIKFQSVAKIRQWAKGLFRGVKRSDQPKSVEVIIR